MPEASDVRANVYLHDGQNILYASSLVGSGEEIELDNVTWYERGQNGDPRWEIKATSATYAAPGWRLENPKRFDIGAAEVQQMEEIVVGEGLTPEAIDLQSIDPDAQSFWELSGTIDSYEAAGRRTSEMRANWWHRISGPLSALLMPLLGSVAAFGLARSGQLFVRAVIGMALGFAYFVVDNAALAMGSFGGYPPFLAAWAPFFLFLLVGETVLIRTEE
jgi:lipopolysaccharide export system permease protein